MAGAPDGLRLRAGLVETSEETIPRGRGQVCPASADARRAQGPLQRRFRLASVHLDTAGRTVFAMARDRDQTKATLSWRRYRARAARRAREAEIGTGPPQGRVRLTSSP